jgi:cation transport ATPase
MSVPISPAAFVVALALLFGVPLLLWVVCWRSKRLALWCGAGIIVFIVVGNALEKLTTGQSGLF